MLNKYFFAIFLFILSGSAHGQEFCVRPVPGVEPILNTNTDTNFLTRIPGEAYIMPGYKGVVLNTRDYYKNLLHFNGKELSEIKDDFPHASGFAYQNIHTDLMGNSYGFGRKPKRIYYLPKDGTKWETVEDPNNYKRVLFDRGGGGVYFSRDGAWEQMRNGKIIGGVDMPTHDKTSYIDAIRSVPKLSGTFTLIRPSGYKHDKQPNQSLWFKPEDGDWQKIDIPFRDKFLSLIDLNKSSFDVSDDLVSIFRGNGRAPLFLSKTTEGLTFQGVGPAGYWRKYEESKSWLAWIGKTSQMLEKKHWFGLIKSRNKPAPPKLFLLRNGKATAEEIKGVKPYSSISKVYRIYSWIPNEALGLFFIDAETGLVVYDGTDFTQPEALLYTNIGKIPRIKVLNGDAYIQSQKGVFRLSPELEVTQIDNFPITIPSRSGIEINYFKHADRYLISGGDNHEFFTSPDMNIFTKLENEEKAKTIKAVLQDPPIALVGGKKGKVYMVTQDCTASK